MKYKHVEDEKVMTVNMALKVIKQIESEHHDTNSMHWWYAQLKEAFIYNISQEKYTIKEITQIAQAINNINWKRYSDGEVFNQLQEDLIS